MAMTTLLDVETLAAPGAAVQDNFEALDRLVCLPFTPTFVSGVANTVIGAPTTGAHVVKEAWVDVNGALWECTVAGTPGTWRQQRPAAMAADPVAGTYPTGYRIWRTDVRWEERYCSAGGTPGTWAWAGLGLTAVADATGAGDVVAQLNSLLARLRTAGIILP